MKPLFSNSAIAATVGSLIDEVCSFKRIVKLSIGPYRIKASVHLPLDALRTEHEWSISRNDNNEAALIESLSSAVDMLRRAEGKPSIAEEAESLVNQREEIAPIPFQPGSRCVCGSHKPMRLSVRLS